MCNKLCKDCKYWTRRRLYYTKYRHQCWDKKWYTDDTWDDTPFQLGDERILEQKEIDSNFGECSQGCMQYTGSGGCIEDDDLDPDNSSAGLIYSDNEAYGAYLYTGQDFGCIHFETKKI